MQNKEYPPQVLEIAQGIVDAIQGKDLEKMVQATYDFILFLGDDDSEWTKEVRRRMEGRYAEEDTASSTGS